MFRKDDPDSLGWNNTQIDTRYRLYVIEYTVDTRL